MSEMWKVLKNSEGSWIAVSMAAVNAEVSADGGVILTANSWLEAVPTGFGSTA